MRGSTLQRVSQNREPRWGPDSKTTVPNPPQVGGAASEKIQHRLPVSKWEHGVRHRLWSVVGALGWAGASPRALGSAGPPQGIQ